MKPVKALLASLLITAGLAGCASTNTTSSGYTTMDKSAQALMLAKIKPAVSEVSLSGDRSSKNDAFVQMVAEANVKRTVNDIKAKSPVLKAMADAGEIKIVVAMLDVKTGAVTRY